MSSDSDLLNLARETCTAMLANRVGISREKTKMLDVILNSCNLRESVGILHASLSCTWKVGATGPAKLSDWRRISTAVAHLKAPPWKLCFRGWNAKKVSWRWPRLCNGFNQQTTTRSARSQSTSARRITSFTRGLHLQSQWSVFTPLRKTVSS